MRQRCKTFIATGSLAASLALIAVPAGAIGYYNLPGNVCQWLGYGNGAGYHSCLVLGPTTPHGCFAHHEVRLAHPPAPTCGCGGYDHSAAPRLGPSILPADHPEQLPPPAAMRPQILR